MTEDRYEDCDRCGERYDGEFIERYLHDETPTAEEAKAAGIDRDGVLRVCCEPKKVTPKK